ncbi:hypothetical protein BU17DRAFT_68606 [Hysterangium stoloniferum]|nr:hypothetical protein BU17DRAFT_68606 [Hysterangium stoloniferum]
MARVGDSVILQLGRGRWVLVAFMRRLAEEPTGAAVWDKDSQTLGGGARCRMEDHLIKIRTKVKIKVASQERNEDGVYLAGSCMEWEWLLALEIRQFNWLTSEDIGWQAFVTNETNMVFPTLSLQSKSSLPFTIASALAVGRIRDRRSTINTSGVRDRAQSAIMLARGESEGVGHENKESGRGGQLDKGVCIGFSTKHVTPSGDTPFVTRRQESRYETRRQVVRRLHQLSTNMECSKGQRLLCKKVPAPVKLVGENYVNGEKTKGTEQRNMVM